MRLIHARRFCFRTSREHSAHAAPLADNFFKVRRERAAICLVQTPALLLDFLARFRCFFSGRAISVFSERSFKQIQMLFKRRGRMTSAASTIKHNYDPYSFAEQYATVWFRLCLRSHFLYSLLSRQENFGIRALLPLAGFRFLLLISVSFRRFCFFLNWR